MSSSHPVPWTIRDVAPSDRDEWEGLFVAYAASAGDELTAAHLDRVWSWLLDPDESVEGLLLLVAEAPVGLAHVRTFRRPLAGSTGCFLDDLYVTPGHRGRGGARALLEHLATRAGEHGWTTVRWTTKETNPAARLYDTVATRAGVITYDMAPGPVAEDR